MIEFNSVRAINKACKDACYGHLSGRNVYIKIYCAPPKTPEEAQNTHIGSDGRGFTLLRIFAARAKEQAV